MIYYHLLKVDRVIGKKILFCVWQYCIFQSETYSIQDYILYDFDTIAESKTYGQNIGSTSFKMEFDVNLTATNSLAYFNIGTDSNNNYYVGVMYQSNNQGVMVRVNGGNTQHKASTNIPLNTDAHIVFTYDNGELTYSDGDEVLTVFDSDVTPSKLMSASLRSATISNMKIYNL